MHVGHVALARAYIRANYVHLRVHHSKEMEAAYALRTHLGESPPRVGHALKDAFMMRRRVEVVMRALQMGGAALMHAEFFVTAPRNDNGLNR